MTKASKPMVGEAELRARLATRYAAPEWNLYHEVVLGTRRADAMAINLWASRGLQILGFEIKVTRQDWVKELKDPAKMERTFRECHSVYLVVSDPAIVRDDLPPGWGLLIPHGPHLKVTVKPAVKEPENTRTFWAKILQHEQKTLAARVNAEAAKQAKALRSESQEISRLEKQLATWQGMHRELADQIREMRSKHGDEEKAIEWLAAMAHIDRERTIAGAQALMRFGFDGSRYGRLNNLQETAERLLEKSSQAFEDIKAINAIMAIAESTES